MNSLAMIRSALCETPINYNIISDALKLARPDEKEMLVQYLASHVKQPPPAWIAGERKVFQAKNVELVMKWIPTGKFPMGAIEGETAFFIDATPQREVTITGFWMQANPMTQGEYEGITGKNPSYHNYNRGEQFEHPVEQISWHDACKCAEDVSRATKHPVFSDMGVKEENFRERKGWRLPTEAEWEYACRAGTVTPRYGEMEDISWSLENSGNNTQPVCEKQPNAWGLYDMLGNVQEWCYDWYRNQYPESQVNPISLIQGGGYKLHKVTRGGSCSHYEVFHNANVRMSRESRSPARNIGFRLVMIE